MVSGGGERGWRCGLKKLGGGWVFTWFSGGTEGDQSLPTEYEGATFGN